MNRFLAFAVATCCISLIATAAESVQTLTVKGWVLDSSCAITQNLKKPISSECAIACAKAGSPLAILDDRGHIYLPVSATMPASSQNEKLLPFAGQRVVVTGKVYDQNGTHGIVINDIKAEAK